MAGLLGVQQGLRLPPAVALDPGTLSEQQRQVAGIQRLPATLGEALEAFQLDTGEPLLSGTARSTLPVLQLHAVPPLHRQALWLAGWLAWLAGRMGTSTLLSPGGRCWPAVETHTCTCPCLHTCMPPPSAELQASLDHAFGTTALVRAFLAVRRSEWEHYRDMTLEQEAAALYARY